MRRTALNMIVLATAAALAMASAYAQSPSAVPTGANIAGSNAPGNVPEGWRAQGWSQSDWIALYEACLNIPAETTRRMHLTPEQRRDLKPILGDWEMCKHLASSFSARPGPSSPSAAPT